MTTGMLVGLLTLGELVLMLGALSVFLFLRQRRYHRVAVALSQRLKAQQAESENSASEAPGYAELLKSELEQATALLEADAQEEGGLHGEAQARDALSLRQRFLEIELASLADQETCMDQLHARIEAFGALRREMASEAAPAETEQAGETTAESTPDTKTDTSPEEIAHLKQVIDNQFQVIRQMRGLLDAQARGSAELQALLDTLETDSGMPTAPSETEPAAVERDVQIPDEAGDVDLAEAASGK